MRRGISLIELLLTLALLAVTLSAAMRAFVAGLDFESHFPKAREAAEERIAFEDGLSNSIQGADLSDPASALVSPVPSPSTGQTQNPPSDGLAAGSSSLLVTTWNSAPSQSYLQQSQSSWESLNSNYGPQGGTEQVALSLVPVGDAGLKQGLFVREQRPPQTDVSQGGTERLLSPSIKDIRFEFFDGTNWLTAWDTRSGDQKGKLPLEVRVTYLRRDEDSPHTFTVRLRMVPHLPPPSSPNGTPPGTPPVTPPVTPPGGTP